MAIFNFSKNTIAANNADTMKYNVPEDFNEIIDYCIIGNHNGSWIIYGLNLEAEGKFLYVLFNNFFQDELSVAGGKLILYYR